MYSAWVAWIGYILWACSVASSSGPTVKTSEGQVQVSGRLGWLLELGELHSKDS